MAIRIIPTCEVEWCSFNQDSNVRSHAHVAPIRMYMEQISNNSNEYKTKSCRRKITPLDLTASLSNYLHTIPTSLTYAHCIFHNTLCNLLNISSKLLPLLLSTCKKSTWNSDYNKLRTLSKTRIARFKLSKSTYTKTCILVSQTRSVKNWRRSADDTYTSLQIRSPFVFRSVTRTDR